jgi:hypothetical protein
MKVAVCDPDAFYPLRSLVAGPLETLDDLSAIERFIRTVVLHDEMIMELTPWPYDSGTDFEFTEEEKQAGGRNVITAIGPVLTGYDFFTDQVGKYSVPEIEPSPALIGVASRFANASEGNVYFEAHVDYMKRVLGIAKQGGSVLLCSEFGQQVVTSSQKYPDIFKHLDENWQSFAQSAQKDGLGLLVPPVLGIVLSRCARRDAIPVVIRDLREEWAYARRKVWDHLDALRTSKTLAQAQKIERELSDASRLFSPKENDYDSRPVRIFWEIVAAAAAGAFIGQMSGGKPIIGAATGAIAKFVPSVTTLVHEFGPALFGRGAFDLANKVRRETAQAELNCLQRLLTDAEKRKLGF